jgi:DNA-binding transcriptional LysR family regulator
MDQLLAIRTFVRIAEAGSLAKAADTLELPRSSVSKLLQDLEAHLGVRLVERTTRAVTMTPEGLAYRERALRLLDDLEDMDATVAGARGAPQGRLRVDVGSILANLILIPRLSEFTALYPDIELYLGVSDRAADIVSEGIDCVIRGGELADSTMKARKLCELDYVVCATPSYFQERPTPGHPNDLTEGHEIVSYFSASTGKRFPLRFEWEGEQIDITAAGCLAVNESTAHLSSLVAGAGIGQTFGFLARPRFEDGTLIEVLPEWKPRNHVLNLVYPGGRFPNARTRAFADWAERVFKDCDARQQISQRQPSSIPVDNVSTATSFRAQP